MEVEEWRWSEVDALRELLKTKPAAFSAWFALAFERLVGTWNAPAAPSQPVQPVQPGPVAAR